MLNSVKINNYKNALVEVETVLKCLEYEDYYKIPKEIIEAIIINKNEEYIFEYDDELDYVDWGLMPETKALLYNIFKKYIATNEQKQYFIQKEKLEIMQHEQEKSKQYNVDNIFKKTNAVETPMEKIEETRMTVIQEEKWYNKIFNMIKKLFK